MVTGARQRAFNAALLVLGLCACGALWCARAQNGPDQAGSAGPTAGRPAAPLSSPAKAPATAAKPSPSPSPAPLKVGGVTISGSLRLRLESWDWFDTSAARNDYNFGAALLRLAIGQQREKFDWQIEGAFPLLIGIPTDAIAPAPQGQLGLGAAYFAANGRQDGSAFIKQAFVRFKGLGSDQPSSLRLGRFEFIDGAETTPANATLATLKRDHIAHRLIGPFTFTHVGRSFDGLHYARTTKTSNITFVAARPTEGVFQLRGWNELNIDFYYGAYTKPFKYRKAESETRIFALHYHDGRHILKSDNRPLAARAADLEDIRVTTLGGHYISVLQTGSGKTDVLVWGAGQFGQWGRLDHTAGAIAAEIGYQPGGSLAERIKPWARAGYFRSTGDGNPADNQHHTFFQVLPTPRVYARFPFYNLMNNEDVFGQVRLRPHPKLALRIDAHHLRLSKTQDMWYQGGGAFQQKTFGYVARPANGHKTLGTLIDASLDYTIAPRTTLSFYLGGVRGGGVAARIYPEGRNARFAYIELAQRF
jgi:hypothetical protein